MPSPPSIDLDALSLDDLKRLVVERLLRVTAQEEEIRALREELAQVKKVPKRPKLAPGGMDEATEPDKRDKVKAACRPKRRGRSGKRTSPATEERTLTVEVPPGSRRIDPLAGWREVTDHRCRTDWGHVVKELLDGRSRDVDTVTLVMDQLNTHSLASFYQAFEPAEARRLTDRLEIHHTPKHGSWLNIAEIELSALSRQCLDQRIANAEILKREVATWKACRNDAKTRVHWRFTTANARIKLHRLYPSIKP
jgi:uncharacterized small protein (DUF1192 family)